MFSEHLNKGTFFFYQKSPDIDVSQKQRNNNTTIPINASNERFKALTV
jgi:hypothetical protein